MAFYLVPRSLRYFEAVAEHGSIQAASRAVGISASSIDRQIVLLEEWLGVTLFDRVAKGMVLSAAGESVLSLARRWRQDETRLWSDVKQMQGIDFGHVRLVVMDSLASPLIADFVGRASRQFQRVQIDVHVATTDGAQTALAEGEADVVVAFNLRVDRDTHVIWSADLPLVCVAAPGHPLAGQERLTLAEVRAHRLVLQSPSLAIRRMLEARHTWHFTDRDPPVVTNSLQFLKHLVTAGSHVALTSELDAAADVLAGRMVSVPVTDAAVKSQSISVAVSAKRSLPRVCMTIAHVLAEDLSQTVRAVSERPGKSLKNTP